MEIVRLYDAARQPSNWTDLVGAGQLVAFVSDAETGAASDADGHPTYGGDHVCLFFDSLAEARAFGTARVEEHPGLQVEVFDAAGRVHPPLLVIIHPSRTAAMEGSARGVRIRLWSSVGMLILAPFLAWYDHAASNGSLVLPTFLAVTMVVTAGRLLFMNYAVAEAERAREARVKAHQAATESAGTAALE